MNYELNRRVENLVFLEMSFSRNYDFQIWEYTNHQSYYMPLKIYLCAVLGSKRGLSTT